MEQNTVLLKCQPSADKDNSYKSRWTFYQVVSKIRPGKKKFGQSTCTVIMVISTTKHSSGKIYEALTGASFFLLYKYFANHSQI